MRSRLNDRLDRSLLLGLKLTEAQQAIRISPDHHQQIVKVMRYATGNTAKRFKPLLLLQ